MREADFSGVLVARKKSPLANKAGEKIKSTVRRVRPSIN